MKRFRLVIEVNVTQEEIDKVIEKYGSLEKAAEIEFGSLNLESDERNVYYDFELSEETSDVD